MSMSTPRPHKAVTKDLDGVVVFCREVLYEAFGPKDGEVAFLSLPALEALVAFKAQDRKGLVQWGKSLFA